MSSDNIRIQNKETEAILSKKVLSYAQNMPNVTFEFDAWRNNKRGVERLHRISDHTTSVFEKGVVGVSTKHD